MPNKFELVVGWLVLPNRLLFGADAVAVPNRLLEVEAVVVVVPNRLVVLGAEVVVVPNMWDEGADVVAFRKLNGAEDVVEGAVGACVDVEEPPSPPNRLDVECEVLESNIERFLPEASWLGT